LGTLLAVPLSWLAVSRSIPAPQVRARRVPPSW
jgi:hypothetical protein